MGKVTIRHVVEKSVPIRTVTVPCHCLIPAQPRAWNTRAELNGHGENRREEVGAINQALERMPQSCAETTMTNTHLPAEMLDRVVDYLHDTRDALRNCCLVSKSWIPRTRMHLFADIEFPTARSLQSWKEASPDPSTSPACYVKTLHIDWAAPGVEEGAGSEGFLVLST